MFAIQPIANHSGDEKLRTIGIRASVCHAQQARFGMFELKVLVGKFGSIDTLPTSAIMVGEISALKHELGNHAVEAASLVAKSILTGAKLSEITCCLRYDVVVELKDDASKRGAISANFKKAICHSFEIQLIL